MNDERVGAPLHGRPPRKPYVPPTVESEEILETSALVCGKCTVGPTGGLGCGALPLNS